MNGEKYGNMDAYLANRCSTSVQETIWTNQYGEMIIEAPYIPRKKRDQVSRRQMYAIQRKNR